MRTISVVVVEDNDLLRELTVDFLQEAGHATRGAADAQTLDELLAAEPADVVVLDIGLPGENGRSICRRLRRASPRLGIIMLTALGSAQQRVHGYEDGADIYLAKPTSNEELSAAVAGLARRAAVEAAAEPGSRALRLSAAELSVEGPEGRQALTDAEVKILRGLAMAAQRQLETWQLLELLSMPVGEDAKAALEVRIVRLRKKLLASGATEPGIKAVRGVGYQLVARLTLS